MDEGTLVDAVRRLAAADSSLGASVARFGPPPLWAREPSFATLVHLVLEQQVSLASALAAFERLRVATSGEVTAVTLLRLGDAEMREIGFSRQKAAYVRELARTVTDGFSLAEIERLPDDEARAALIRLRGIGRWTADVYLTMCLLRPDIWPRGDRALAVGAVELLGLAPRPDDEELAEIAERWRPNRAVAARIIWHEYLRVRGRAA